MRGRWFVQVVMLLALALAGCRKEQRAWRVVTSELSLYSFQVPPEWTVDPTSTEATLGYRSPTSQGDFTLSGYWRIEPEEILAAAWSGIANNRPLGPWRRNDGIGWHRYEQRLLNGPTATDLLVIISDRKSAVVATLTDTLEALEDNRETYRHMLDSVTLDPRAKEPRR